MTAETVVVRLLARVRARLRVTGLRRGELLEAGRHDGVELLVLPPVRHHLVGVRAHELALEAVEVGGLVLHGAERGRVHAVRPVARHVGAELLEVAAHERVQALVARGVLHEARLVAERVAAVLPHAVEVRLVFPVAAVRVLAVLVEPEDRLELLVHALG